MFITCAPKEQSEGSKVWPIKFGDSGLHLVTSRHINSAAADGRAEASWGWGWAVAGVGGWCADCFATAGWKGEPMPMRRDRQYT
jgi:hypothetical protein